MGVRGQALFQEQYLPVGDVDVDIRHGKDCRPIPGLRTTRDGDGCIQEVLLEVDVAVDSHDGIENTHDHVDGLFVHPAYDGYGLREGSVVDEVEFFLSQSKTLLKVVENGNLLAVDLIVGLHQFDGDLQNRTLLNWGTVCKPGDVRVHISTKIQWYRRFSSSSRPFPDLPLVP